MQSNNALLEYIQKIIIPEKQQCSLKNILLTSYFIIQNILAFGMYVIK